LCPGMAAAIIPSVSRLLQRCQFSLAPTIGCLLAPKDGLMYGAVGEFHHLSCARAGA
jgi:hypothetical protein